MSNCVVGSVGLRLPRSIIAEHSVEGSDHFSHDGDDYDLGFLVGVGKTIGEGLESGIVSACAEGCHVEDITDRHPTAVDTAVSPELATVEVVWCETDEGGDLLAAHRPEFWQQGDEREGQHRADARHRGEQLIELSESSIGGNHLGGAAALPLAAHAQERMRRIGVLMTLASNDPEGQTRIGAFLQGLQQSGWSIGRNVQIETRWAAGQADAIRKHASELVALAPDVILATGSATPGPLLQATRTVPIVFTAVPDPVGAGFVDSLARPGGNATGFLAFEYSLSGKRLELLKQIAPGVTRVAVLRDATQGSGTSQFAAIQTAAPSLSVEVNPVNMRDAGEIERAVTAFARSPNGGLIVAAGPAATRHRDLIVKLATRHRLPAVYVERAHVTAGGLMSYGAGGGLCGSYSQGRETCRPAGAGADQVQSGDQS